MNASTSSVSFAGPGWNDEADLPSAGPVPDDRGERLRRAECDAECATAALELVNKFVAAPDLDRAGIVLVGELQNQVGCQQVALGLRRGNRRPCQLLALSGLARFDARSEFVRAVEAALEECCLRGTTSVWPAASDSDRHALLAIRHVAMLAGVERVIGVPIRNGPEEIVACLLVLGGPESDECGRVGPLLRFAAYELGKWLELVQRAEPGAVVRRWRQLRQQARGRRGTIVLAAAIAISILLALPMPYKIRCDCLVQPSLRRFVVAPFEARLEQSLVKQGDVVRQGQILARLDGRELRWELAGLVAERGRAGKQRDSAMATKKVADALAARLEMDRLDLKIQLLEHRVDNLDIRSPIDGVLISGDLDRAQGAPVTIGQTLFEVAPLDNMLVELGVPEEDVSYAQAGQAVRVRLDAYPGRAWSATVAKIHPRAEVRDGRNAFIAELQLENPHHELRPGMNGQARITGPRKPFGWNLFHRAFYWIARFVGY